MFKLLCLLFCSCPLFGQQLSNSLDSLMQQHFSATAPGAALMVARDGKVIYAKGFGQTDIKAGKNQSISPATNFRMASVSKQFTAMCIAMLEQQHKISYNDKLAEFFPEWNEKVASLVSVKQLLNHSSGIWDYEDLIPTNQKEQVLDADIVSYLLNRDTLYFAPGTAFRYSNSGFCVLAQIVEKVSGMSYPAFCSKYIFRPLGMHNTIIYQQGANIVNRAMGFARDATGAIIESDQSVTSAAKGDGGVYTSINDYFKWATWLMDKPANLTKKLELVNRAVDNSTTFKYGLGWFNFTDETTGLTLYHTGSTCGFSSVVKVNPKSKLVIAYFSNIADNHAIFYEAEKILKQFKIDTSATGIKQLIDFTR